MRDPRAVPPVAEGGGRRGVPAPAPRQCFAAVLESVHGEGPRCSAPAGAADEAAPDAAGAAELTAVAEAWAAAIVSNDAERVAGFMADDWAIVSESAIASKDESLTYVDSGQLTRSAMDLVSRPRIRAYGDTAVFSGRITDTAPSGGRRFDADEWTTDVFVRRGGGRWLCVLTHITAAAQEPGTWTTE